MAVNIIFYFGLKEGTLESQANEQGYTLGEYAGVAQNIVGTLITCRLHDIINENEHHIILVSAAKNV